MATKMTDGQLLVALGLFYTVIFLNTLFAWLWPDASIWALGVVMVLSVLGVLWAYRISRKESPPASQGKE